MSHKKKPEPARLVRYGTQIYVTVRPEELTNNVRTKRGKKKS